MSFLSGRTSLTTVQTGDIAAGAITTAKIAANNVDSTLTKDALIGDYTEVTIATGDSLLLGDVNDSGNTKRDTVQGLLDLVSAGGFTQGTEQAATSGTSITFGSIPAGVDMIVVNLEDISLSSAAEIDLTIGDAGGLETSGYNSASVMEEATNARTMVASTAEFIINAEAADFVSGAIFLTLKDAAAFTWLCSFTLFNRTGARLSFGAGDKSLTAELTQLSLSGGTFDGSGSINIMYQ